MEIKIRSDKGIVSGRPRIDGTRLWVSHVVSLVEGLTMKGYLDEFHVSEAQVKEALDYCRQQNCVDSVVSYCSGCTKDTSPQVEGEGKRRDLWVVAEELYQGYFG